MATIAAARADSRLVMLVSGLDRLLDEGRDLGRRRWGLLSHAASVTRSLESIVPALCRSSASAPSALYAPEHGFHAAEQDMVPAVDTVDPVSGAPVRSLYGDSVESLRPDARAFEGLDLLLIDLVDVGARYYTFAATAIWAARAAAEVGLDVWLLDRPNPLGGDAVEGNLRRGGFESFVGAFSLPVRHGLTVGELLLLDSDREGWDRGPVEVVEVAGWSRKPPSSDDGWIWRAPSPNMPREATAWLYPGSCLFEGTGLSEGRGTTRPFELIGAPGVDGVAVAADMNRKELAGAAYLAVQFRPQFQKHAGELCDGVEIIVSDRDRFESLRAGVELLECFHRVAGAHWSWRRRAYEFVEHIPAIDLLAGTDELRRSLDDGLGVDEWTGSWRGDEAAFREERESVLLYR